MRRYPLPIKAAATSPWTIILSLPMVGLLISLSSCAPGLDRMYPVTVEDYASLIEQIGASNHRIVTDRRIFDFKVRRGTYSTSGEGVFLYRSPGRVRIDLYLGSAELVFQYFRQGDGEPIVILPAEGRVIRGSGGKIALTGFKGLEEIKVEADELTLAMLGTCAPAGGLARIGSVREGKAGYLITVMSGEEEMLLIFERKPLSIKGYRVLAGGDEKREIRFSSFKTVEGIARPMSMSYKDRTSGIEIRFSVRTESVNEEIGPEVFVPPVGWDEP